MQGWVCRCPCCSLLIFSVVEMSVDSPQQDQDDVETKAGSVISLLSADAVGTFELEHDLLFESTESVHVTGTICFWLQCTLLPPSLPGRLCVHLSVCLSVSLLAGIPVLRKCWWNLCNFMEWLDIIQWVTKWLDFEWPWSKVGHWKSKGQNHFVNISLQDYHRESPQN